VIAGSIKVIGQNGTHTLESGDTIYLKADFPTQWINSGTETAELLWMKIR
jgi:glyoxylate utilization-related uncharacterized protein